jgi:hypothetical protein
MVSEIVNKFNVPRYPKIVEPLFAMDIPQSIVSGFHSSTEQPLSTKWQYVHAITINLHGKKQTFDSLYENIDDIIDNINESLGCDEQHPLIQEAFFGTKIKIGDYKAQALYLKYNPIMAVDNVFIKENASKTFMKILNEYYGSSISANINQSQPLMMDLSTAKPFKSALIMSTNKSEK